MKRDGVMPLLSAEHGREELNGVVQPAHLRQGGRPAQSQIEQR